MTRFLKTPSGLVSERFIVRCEVSPSGARSVIWLEGNHLKSVRINHENWESFLKELN